MKPRCPVLVQGRHIEIGNCALCDKEEKTRFKSHLNNKTSSVAEDIRREHRVHRLVGAGTLSVTKQASALANYERLNTEAQRTTELENSVFLRASVSQCLVDSPEAPALDSRHSGS